jgi:hypothetical protein
MLDLIERLEKATGPDRKIDGAIMAAINPPPSLNKRPSSIFIRFDTDYLGVFKNHVGTPLSFKASVPDYTKSIDAAMTLALEPWRLQDIWQSDDGDSWHAGVRIPGLEVGSDEACATAAIAVCVAWLKARIALTADKHGSETA